MTRMISMWIAMIALLAPVAASGDVIELDVEVPHPVLWQDDQGFTHVDVKGFTHLGEPGTPALPSRTVYVLIPPGQRVVSVDVRPSGTVDLLGRHVVAPRQAPWPLSWGAPPFTEPDTAVYQNDAPWPERKAVVRPVTALRGFNVQPVTIHPVTAYPASGRLVYSPVITVVVDCTPGRALPAGPAAAYRGFPRDFERVRTLVANPAELDRYPVLQATGRDPDHRYVIVTSAELAGCSGSYTLQTLADDKESRGISTLIKTMEDIRSEYSGVDDAAKVRAFILDMYQNHACDFVLLAGDADRSVVGGETEAPVVPVRDLWGDIGYGIDDVPSDLYYANLDGDFNANGNSTYGESGDNIDTLGEVWVGRAAVDSCTEVSNFVRKTLAYQNAGGGWLSNVYMVGEVLFEGYYAEDDLQHVHYSSSSGGYSTTGFDASSFFTVSTMYDADLGDYGWGQTEILAILNGGNHIINHLGHSYTYYNMRLYTDQIISGLSNSQYFFEYTQGCYPGAFDNRLSPQEGSQTYQQDSFVEHMTLDAHGAFAAVMNTRYGLGAGYSNALHRYFWDAAFGQGMSRLGDMHGYSRDQIAGWISDPAFRWVYYDCNLFGDPELAVHLSMGTEDPYLGLPAGPIRFVVVEDEGNPAPQEITVNNLGAGTLNWTVESSASWLTTAPESGTAPTDVTLSVDATGMGEGAYNATLTFTAPAATNSPQTLEVILNVITVPSVVAPYVSTAPTLDGIISSGEYSAASVVNMGLDPGNPSSSIGHLMHDGTNLYIALEIGDDSDVDTYDGLLLLADIDHDGLWPTSQGDDGMFQLLADGQNFFVPVYNPGSGMQYGDADWAAGVVTAYNDTTPRVVETSFDLSQSNLKFEEGDTFGVFLYYADYEEGSGDLLPAAYWPFDIVTLDDCSGFGAVTIGTVGDCLTVDPGALSFQAIAGGSPTDAQGLTIGSSSGVSLDFTVTSSDSWLQVSQSNGTTPEIVQVTADPAGLSAGTHSGTVTVASPGACDSPAAIPVTFTVEAEPAVISAAPASLYFEAQQNGSLPTGQTLQIDNAGGGTLDWQASKDFNWFVLSESSGTAPSSITVVPIRTDLSAETHLGTITFTAPGAERVEVPISYRITLPPSLGVTPAVLEAESAIADGPVELELQVSSESPVAVEWYLGEDCAWLSANPTSGTAIPMHPSRVMLTLDPAGLSAGLYETDVTVTAPGADNSPATVHVGWTLRDAPSLSVVPSGLQFTAFTGGGDPAPQTLSITNAGSGTLSWTAACDAAWLECVPASGAAPGDVTVTARIDGLAEGVHEASVTIASPEAANSPLEIPVQLNLTSPDQPVIAVDPEILQFQAEAGGQAPAAQTIAVTNAGAGTLDWSATCGQQWLSCTPASGTAPGNVDVAVDHAGMSAGTYNATVMVEAAGAVNSPVEVGVTLTVQSGPANHPPPAPLLVSPADEALIDNPNPELGVQNVVDPDGDAVTYIFEIYPQGAAEPMVVIGDVAQDDGSMTFARVERTLDYDQTYEWRARAVDDQAEAGAWSQSWTFTVLEPKGDGGGCGCAAGGEGGGAEWLVLLLVPGLAVVRRRTAV